ncbi:MAG TPA: polysaccharide biosynthesis tyrosine autokinase, partial [Anaerolineae bacterium]|nr:polysaccharide biosynthesis tyrosine autokinase [Anaerolineae bacterium]
GVTVTPVRDTQLVRVSVESSHPEVAAGVANVLPEVFMQMNRERQQQRFADTRRDLQTELASTEMELEQTRLALIQLGDTEENKNERDRLERLATRYQTTYNNLTNSLENLRLAEAQTTDNIVLTTPAQPANSPVRPRVLYNALLALLVGALFGLGIAFLIEYLDDTVKTPDHVRDLTGLATLGTVVLLDGASPDERMVVHMAPKSPGSEAYRVLRTNLQFSALDKPLATLLCTSAEPGEGKSTTVANLAYAMAQADKRVILIDADMRRPSQHKILKLPNNVGLSTALLDRGRDPAVYLQDTDVANLRVMTTGPIPPNPAEMLNSARMHEMIEILKGEADVVLFDTPPVLAVADTSILASQVDGTLLVVWAGRTRGEMLVQATERLLSLGVAPLGVVLNKLTQRRGSYYYNTYYYYASREGEDGTGGKTRKSRRRRRPSSQRQAEQVS